MGTKIIRYGGSASPHMRERGPRGPRCARECIGTAAPCWLRSWHALLSRGQLKWNSFFMSLGASLYEGWYDEIIELEAERRSAKQ